MHNIFFHEIPFEMETCHQLNPKLTITLAVTF